MKTGRKRMFWMVSILLAACLGIALSACESKGQQPDSALDTNPFTDNIVQESGEDTMAGPMVIINQAGLEPEKGSTFDHTIKFSLTNQTHDMITGYKMGMLAFDREGNPMDIYWIGIDSSVPHSYFHEYQSSDDGILPEGGTESGSWTLINISGEEEYARYDRIGYILYNLKEITFKSGYLWENPEYDRWMDTYKGKPAVPGNLEGYYPLEMRITGME